LKSLHPAGLRRLQSVSQRLHLSTGTAPHLRAAAQLASAPAVVLPCAAPPAVATRYGAVAEAALPHAQAVVAVRQCAAAARRYGAAVEAVSAPPVPD
jgi:uncharacterized protein (DUF885 family)